jgi:hypothetical protein
LYASISFSSVGSCVCGAGLVGGLFVLFVLFVHPAIDNEATITSTIRANNFFIIKIPINESNGSNSLVRA